MFVDMARFGTVYPKQVTYLQKIQPKDPISLENLGNVSVNTTTFVALQPFRVKM